MSEKKDNFEKMQEDVQEHLNTEEYSPEDKKTIEDLQLIRDASRVNALEEKRSFLKTIESNKTSKVKKLSSYIIPIGIAASLIVIAMFFFNQDGAIINNESPLFKEYFEVYPEMLSTRGEIDLQKLERDAILFYKSKHYDRAALSYAELYQRTNSSVHLFYSGMSNLLSDNTDLAIEQLVSIKDKEDVQNIPVKYYLGLAYLKKGEEEKAKLVFENPDKAFQFYVKKSAEILEKLNK
jgi:hypothetical protein